MYMIYLVLWPLAINVQPSQSVCPVSLFKHANIDITDLPSGSGFGTCGPIANSISPMEDSRFRLIAQQLSKNLSVEH